jgi:hypothetical protein
MDITTTSQLPKAPITKDDLHEAVLNLTLLQLRKAFLFSTTPDSNDTLWALIGKQTVARGESLWDPQNVPADFGMAYSDIASCLFAEAIDQMYDFAYFGIHSAEQAEPMGYETVHTWIAAFLIDLEDSRWGDEWEGYGATVATHVTACLNVCEMANARAILEGHGFSYMSRSRNPEADDGDLESLTIRQMALLADVEEISVRAAIRREGPNQLVAFKDDRRTLISRNVAKAWLIAKGKYLPITKNGKSSIDLATDEFTSVAQLKDALIQHAHLLGLSDNVVSKINAFDCGSLRQRALSRRLAEELHLDPNLLSLRFDEADALERLAQARTQMREIHAAAKTVRSQS